MTRRLITIPFSHYCEKARWALDRARIPYREDGHLPLFAWLPALRAGRHRTVPSLVTDDGAITDSTDILRWADRNGEGPPLFRDDDPEVAELEDLFDRRLGPSSRRLAYGHLLPGLGDLMATTRAPRHELGLARALAPAIAAVIRRGLAVDDAGIARSRERVDEVFEQVGRRLADGRRYLTGDRFTAADLTFAALSTALVAPPELSEYIALADPPPALVAQIDDFRARPAGAFALRLYAEDRGRPGAAALAAA